MLVVPFVEQVEMLTAALTPNLSLRLYSNNYTPLTSSVAGDFTEVSGGGYALIALTLAHWGFTNGSIATYDAAQIWTFTGPTDAPATIYGYYITRNSDGKLIYAERFPVGVAPVTPVLGTAISIIPVLNLVNQ